MLYPLRFSPILKERVWGGRSLETLYKKALPPGRPIGESWEISDREGDVSLVANGPLTGKSLRWLMEEHGPALLGPSFTPGMRFPLLVKILDAADRLSLQVHPPPQAAAALKGEPKSELWYVVDAKRDADIFVGLRKGTTRQQFEERIRTGQVAQCFHRIPTHAGDAIFLPSGRVHGIGAGNVIFEIQQNSDTTYRVFDWNRTGLDGKPRELHIQESLASIDFEDFEPELIKPDEVGAGGARLKYLLRHELFQIHTTRARKDQVFHIRSYGAQVIGVIAGRFDLKASGQVLSLKAGDFVLLPACVDRVSFHTHTRIDLLQVQF